MTQLTHSVILGDDRADPVLFIHGFPLDHRMWLASAERIAARGRRCILPDLPGHGRTAVRSPITLQDFADDLAGLLDHIGEHRPVAVVGLSMGGMIAQEFFRRHRPRLSALVLVDTRYRADAPDAVARRKDVAETTLRKGVRPIADAMIGGLLHPSVAPEIRDELYRMMLECPPEGVAAASLALGSREDFTELLPRIDAPTLIVYGEADTITPVSIGREMHAAIPGSELAVIAGAGHMPPMEKPDEFVAVLLRFLDGVRGSGL